MYRRTGMGKNARKKTEKRKEKSQVPRRAKVVLDGVRGRATPPTSRKPAFWRGSPLAEPYC